MDKGKISEPFEEFDFGNDETIEKIRKQEESQKERYAKRRKRDLTYEKRKQERKFLKEINPTREIYKREKLNLKRILEEDE